MTELSEALLVGPPLLLTACGADCADVDAMEANEQAMVATCQVQRLLLECPSFGCCFTRLCPNFLARSLACCY